MVPQGLDSVSDLWTFMRGPLVSNRTLTRVELLPVGANHSPAGLLQGMKVFSCATALILPLADEGTEPVVAWTSQVEKIWSRFERIASLFICLVLGGQPQPLHMGYTA